MLLKIKRFLLTPLKNEKNQKKIKMKKRALSMGSSICCPAVTINLDYVKTPVFRHRFKSNVDWQAWTRLAGEEGAFSYVPEVLMHHRIHEDSETSNLIADNSRAREDYEMFCEFWPSWVAKIIMRLYKFGERSNKV